MDISELQCLPPERVCVECITAETPSSTVGSLGSLARPSPFLPVLLAARANLTSADKVRLLLAAADSPEVPMEDIAAIVSAHAAQEFTAGTQGWLLLARAWNYSPVSIPQTLRTWATLGWHDTKSNWSILPVVDSRPGPIKSLAPAHAVHAAVRESQRWPHPGRRGMARALSGPLWSAFNALEPYRPLWLDAHPAKDSKSMRDVFETFMVISQRQVRENSPELKDLWKAAHALT